MPWVKLLEIPYSALGVTLDIQVSEILILIWRIQDGLIRKLAKEEMAQTILVNLLLNMQKIHLCIYTQIIIHTERTILMGYCNCPW